MKIIREGTTDLDVAELEGGSIEQLAREADALSEPQAGEGAGQIEPVEAPPQTNAQIVAGMVLAIRETVCTVAGLESPQRTLTNEKAEALGMIWGTCLDHYGIRLGDQLGKYGAVLVALASSVQILAPVVVEARKEIAIKDAKPKPAAPTQVSTQVSEPAANGGAYREGVVKPGF